MPLEMFYAALICQFSGVLTVSDDRLGYQNMSVNFFYSCTLVQHDTSTILDGGVCGTWFTAPDNSEYNCDSFTVVSLQSYQSACQAMYYVRVDLQPNPYLLISRQTDHLNSRRTCPPEMKTLISSRRILMKPSITLQ